MQNKKIMDMYQNISKYAIDILFDINEEINIGSQAATAQGGIRVGQSHRISNLFKKIEKEMVETDFTKFNQDELKTLGFRMWDEDGLMLAPRWAFLVMKKGTQLTSISGTTKTFEKDEIDMDTRFGNTAWGLTKDQLRDSKLKSIISETE